MKAGLIGRKVGMTRVCDEAGVVTPVTVIQAGPCTVMQVRTAANDGYYAVQLGFEEVEVDLVRKFPGERLQLRFEHATRNDLQLHGSVSSGRDCAGPRREPGGCSCLNNNARATQVAFDEPQSRRWVGFAAVARRPSSCP